jgi:hypothetical protein
MAKISGLEAKTIIRVGARPQKVVDPIYRIDIPNPSPKTTPIPDRISIPLVSDHYPEDELSTNEPEQIKEASRLVAVEIDAPDLIFLKPSQERIFTVHGIDQFGKYIDPGNIFWKATGGKIDSQGKLIVENDAKGSFRVTAISSKTKISQHRLQQNLLLIKISLKIFFWIPHSAGALSKLAISKPLYHKGYTNQSSNIAFDFDRQISQFLTLLTLFSTSDYLSARLHQRKIVDRDWGMSSVLDRGDLCRRIAHESIDHSSAT